MSATGDRHSTTLLLSSRVTMQELQAPAHELCSIPPRKALAHLLLLSIRLVERSRSMTRAEHGPFPRIRSGCQDFTLSSPTPPEKKCDNLKSRDHQQTAQQ